MIIQTKQNDFIYKEKYNAACPFMHFLRGNNFFFRKLRAKECLLCTVNV